MRTLALALALSTVVACSSVHGGAVDGGLEDTTSPPDAPAPDTSVPDGGSAAEPRLIVASADGSLASLALAPPHAVGETRALGADIASVRCRGEVCLAVLPSPADRVEVLHASDLSTIRTVTLERGSDPRDAVFLGDTRAVISLHAGASLVILDPTTGATDSLDLTPLADADGLPEGGHVAHCGDRVFVQLGRRVHATGEPSEVPSILGVADVGATPALVDADPTTPGVQGIELIGPADFDMQVDCAASTLWVAEPAPLASEGGGRYETVDLDTFVATENDLSTGAQVGGFAIVREGLVWLIGHTDFGPGTSSHLTLAGAPSSTTYNTFSGHAVDTVVVDAALDLAFFPDPCAPGPSNPGCVRPGLAVFDATTGALRTELPIDLGFDPLEVEVAR